MALILTLDASVFVNAASPDVTGADESRRFMKELASKKIPLVEPTLVLAEVAAAIARGTGDKRRALAFADAIRRISPAVFVTLDEHAAVDAARIAASAGLRAADAVYIAAAEKFGARLVTLDKEQLARAPRHVKAVTPRGLGW